MRNKRNSQSSTKARFRRRGDHLIENISTLYFNQFVIISRIEFHKIWSLIFDYGINEIWIRRIFESDNIQWGVFVNRESVWADGSACEEHKGCSPSHWLTSIPLRRSRMIPIEQKLWVFHLCGVTEYNLLLFTNCTWIALFCHECYCLFNLINSIQNYRQSSTLITTCIFIKKKWRYEKKSHLNYCFGHKPSF